MTKLVVSMVSILLVSSAYGFDYSAMANEGGHDNKMHQCVHKGFESAKISEEQHKQIHGYMMNAKNVMKEHKEAIHNGMQSMMTAWKKHPISKDEVVAAEGNLQQHMTPVKVAMRDSMIDSLNVLSADQRKDFDSAFASCMKSE